VEARQCESSHLAWSSLASTRCTRAGFRSVGRGAHQVFICEGCLLCSWALSRLALALRCLSLRQRPPVHLGGTANACQVQPNFSLERTRDRHKCQAYTAARAALSLVVRPFSMRRKLKIPGDMEWSGYETDLDVRDAHRMMFGKSIEEVQAHFGDAHSISRADELLFMPRGAFQYYALAFAEFLKSDRARGDSDSASSFIRLLLARQKTRPRKRG
jgi:hypothetical protein